MKLHCLLLSIMAIFACQIPTFSQTEERVDTESFPFYSKSTQLKSYSLWDYDKLAMKWVEDKSSDELTYLQTFTCEYDNKPYYVLLWAYRNGAYYQEPYIALKDGEYDYATIDTGYYTWPEYFCLIFDESEWSKYDTLNPTSNIVMKASYSTTSIKYYDNKEHVKHNHEVNDFVRQTLMNKSNSQENHNLYLTETSGKDIRFSLYPLANSEHYFETSKKNFDSIMISFPEDNDKKSISSNPGKEDSDFRAGIAISAAIIGSIIGAFVGIFL